MLKTRGFLLTLAYCVWGLVLFVIFTVAYFPFKQMFDAAFAPRGLSLSYEELRFAFPVGITLSQAKLTLPAYSSTFELQSSETTLRPVLTSFLWARPTLAIESKLYRGSAQVFVSRQEARNIGLWFEVVNVDLAKLNQLSGAAGSVSGLVSSRGELVLDQAGTPAGPGHIDLEAKNVVIRLGTGIFSLSFTTLGGALALDPQKLVVQRLDARGPELALTVQGTIHLARNWALSTVDLACRLDPTPLGRERLGVLMRLLPHPPDNRPYVIRGPVLMPSIT